MSSRHVVLAAALLVASLPVLAQSSASVQLTGLRLQLVDLDPSDGITPSISFLGGTSRGEATVSFASPGGSGSDSRSFTGLAGPWAPGSAAISGAFGAASSVLSGSGEANGSALSVSGTATSPGDGFCLPESSGFNQCFTSAASFGANLSPNAFSGSFALSANTLMVLSVDVSLAASAMSGGVIEQFSSFPLVRSDSATASVNLFLSGSGPSGGGSQSSNDGQSLFLNSAYNSETGFVPNSGSFSGSLAVSYSNLSSGTLSGNYSLNLSTNGFAYGNARLVPEPGSWALMLAGLAGMTALARRRRRA